MKLVLPPSIISWHYWIGCPKRSPQDSDHNNIRLHNIMKKYNLSVTLCIQLIRKVYNRSWKRNQFEFVINTVELLMDGCFEAPRRLVQLKCQKDRALLSAFFGFFVPTIQVPTSSIVPYTCHTSSWSTSQGGLPRCDELSQIQLLTLTQRHQVGSSIWNSVLLSTMILLCSCDSQCRML